MARGKSGVLGTVLIVLLFLAGLATFIAPSILSAISERSMNSQLEQVHQATQGTSSGSSGASSGAQSAPSAGTQENQTAEIPAEFVAYNNKVRNGEYSLTDPFSSGGVTEVLTGLPDGLVGSISIPAMNLDLPLYFGASEAHLQKGAAVVLGTSLPLGETNSNCVIAGHRGAIQTEMFRYIEKLQVGDFVTVTTPWHTMVYRVSGMSIISPQDAESVAIQPNKDMITLLTCHPYPTNSQRYLVYAERVPDELVPTGENVEAQGIAQFFNLGDVIDSEGNIDVLHLEGWLRLAGCVLIALFIVLVIVRMVRKVRVDSADIRKVERAIKEEQQARKEDEERLARAKHSK